MPLNLSFSSKALEIAIRKEYALTLQLQADWCFHLQEQATTIHVLYKVTS